MAASASSTRYGLLFELWVLHHYWLDVGTTLFDALPAEMREQQLRAYDVRRLLELRPTQATAKRLAGLGGLCRPTSLGLLVLLPQHARVEDEALFEFTLRIVDRDLPAYSAYGLRLPTTNTLYHPKTGRPHRFRAYGALFSNLGGCSRGAGPNKQLFLSREIPPYRAQHRVDQIVQRDGSLLQLLSDAPYETLVRLGEDVRALPGFATHADVPLSTPPGALIPQAPPLGFELPAGAPDDTHALIRIRARRPSDEDFSCVRGGELRPRAPRFQLRLKNRHTLWRRIAHGRPRRAPVEEGPYPLTHVGNPSNGSKPTRHALRVERVGRAVQRVVSEIHA